MKIAAIETEWVSIPFHHGGPSSGFGATNWNKLDTLLVKVTTDDGIVGWGEAFGYNAIPATRMAVERMVAPLAIGRDAGSIPTLMLELQKSLHNFGRYGQTLFALSGLDIALWDIAAKAAGVPLHRLFGQASPADVPAYASLLRYGVPEVVRGHCAAAIEEGYRHIKLHERGVPSVAAAREGAGPDAAIMIDVNCPWTVQQSMEMARAFAPYDILWLEEPVWPPENFGGLAEVRRAGPLAIAAGENACTVWDFEKMLASGAVTYAQPSVTKVGGITEFRKVTALCEASNVLLAPHSPYFGPGFLATIHLLVGTDQPVERYYGNLEADLYGGMTRTKGGRLAVPSGPGIGPDPDPEVIRRYRVQA